MEVSIFHQWAHYILDWLISEIISDLVQLFILNLNAFLNDSGWPYLRSPASKNIPDMPTTNVRSTLNADTYRKKKWALNYQNENR